MKKLLLLLAIISGCCQLHARHLPYVRVYNLSKKLFHKGRVFATTDSSLQLKVKGSIIDIPVSSIGMIRTGRDGTYNFLAGWAIGTLAAVPIAKKVAAQTPLGTGYGADLGPGIAGTVALTATIFAGMLAGGVSTLFKFSRKFPVQGDLQKWKAFQSFITARKEKMQRVG